MSLPPSVHRRTVVRQCADALHEVKDRTERVHGTSAKKFYRFLIEELVGARNRFPLGTRVAIMEVRENYGTLTFVAAIVDWPARKLATKAKILPEHGFWSQAFWWLRGIQVAI